MWCSDSSMYECALDQGQKKHPKNAGIKRLLEIQFPGFFTRFIKIFQGIVEEILHYYYYTWIRGFFLSISRSSLHAWPKAPEDWARVLQLCQQMTLAKVFKDTDIVRFFWWNMSQVCAQDLRLWVLRFRLQAFRCVWTAPIRFVVFLMTFLTNMCCPKLVSSGMGWGH